MCAYTEGEVNQKDRFCARSAVDLFAGLALHTNTKRCNADHKNHQALDSDERNNAIQVLSWDTDEAIGPSWKLLWMMEENIIFHPSQQ